MREKHDYCRNQETTMKIMPVLDEPATSTNGFTPGKVYDVIEQNGESLTVLNDNGHERCVLLDCPSPHLIWDNGRRGYDSRQKCVGHFVRVP